MSGRNSRITKEDLLPWIKQLERDGVPYDYCSPTWYFYGNYTGLNSDGKHYKIRISKDGRYISLLESFISISLYDYFTIPLQPTLNEVEAFKLETGIDYSDTMDTIFRNRVWKLYPYTKLKVC